MGFDLFSAVDVVVPARGKVSVPTDIQVRLPDGCYGRVAAGSGMARNFGIDVGGGVVDPDFRGNLVVILLNHSPVHYHVRLGDRIAQLICERAEIPVLVEKQCLTRTKRGCNGFGSSGR